MWVALFECKVALKALTVIKVQSASFLPSACDAPENFFLHLVSMAVKHNNVLLNLIAGCLYWLTTCFSQLHDHHQVYKS